MAYSIDKTKNQINEIKKNIEVKKGELTKLEETKQALIEGGMEIQGSKLDEKTQKIVMDVIDSALDENAEKGEELASDMNTDMSVLEDMKQETQESMESNSQERASLERKKAMMERFGLGRPIEEGISELDDNSQELSDVQQALIDAQKELSDVSTKLSSL